MTSRETITQSNDNAKCNSFMWLCGCVGKSRNRHDWLVQLVMRTQKKTKHTHTHMRWKSSKMWVWLVRAAQLHCSIGQQQSNDFIVRRKLQRCQAHTHVRYYLISSFRFSFTLPWKNATSSVFCWLFPFWIGHFIEHWTKHLKTHEHKLWEWNFWKEKTKLNEP